MNGILVATTVMVATLASRGRLARTATYQLLRPYPNQRQRVVSAAAHRRRLRLHPGPGGDIPQKR